MTPDITIATEGLGQSVTGTAVNNAGTFSTATVSGINIDKTAPEISIENIPVEAVAGDKYIVDYSVIDSLSGVDTVSFAINDVVVDKGESIELSEGNTEFMITCSDYAGNIVAKTVIIYVKEKPITEVLYGDINGDGRINSIDFALLRAYLLGIIETFTPENGFIAADLNGDEAVNSIDFALFRAYLLGIIDDFPVNE